MLKFFVLLVFFAVILYSIVQRDKRNKKSSKLNEDLQERIPETEETMNASGIESDEIISNKQDSKNDVNNEKTVKKLTQTHYAEDSLLLLTYIKAKCCCSGSYALSENEKQQIEERLDEALNNVFINRMRSNSICIYEPSDGIAKHPYGNWIEVEKNVKFTDAINLYLELKECVKNEDEVKLDCVEYHEKYFAKKYEDIECLWDKYEIWRANLTFFIVDKDFDLSVIDDKFAEKLKLNNIHLVAQDGKLEFIDLLNSSKYILEYYEQPTGVDWSGTDGFYNLKKLDAKTKDEQLSEELLCKILLSSKERVCRYYGVSFEYFYDVSLNQINIRISLNKDHLYFLTVYVNDSNGMIKKFSFDIEEASDSHYEFDVFAAQEIREKCILNLHDSNYNYEESLNVLLSKYLNEYGESSLIELVESMSTYQFFHFD